MYTVATALYPDALATSVTLPMEILQAASQMASAKSRGQKLAHFLLCSADPALRPVRLASGIALQPAAHLAQLPPIDLLLLPAIWRSPLRTIRGARPWFGLLRRIATANTPICSVGTASALLAEAGLLDDRPATTHWNFFEPFARRYPAVQLKTRHLITQSDNLYCVGSVNSIADLMVHIIERWFGTHIARSIEQQFSPEIRQAFHAAAYQSNTNNNHHDEMVLEAQTLLQDHLGNGLKLGELASWLDVSSSTLSRRFREALEQTPQQYLTDLRLDTAADLLRRSNLSIGEVCWQVGLRDTSSFSRLFRSRFDTSPSRYRKASRGKLFKNTRRKT